MLAAVVEADSDRVDAVRGPLVAPERDVGGRKAEIVPAAVAVLDHRLDRERAGEQVRRGAGIAGDIGHATHLLSRDFAIEGVVQKGDQRGRELGYPTANLELGDYQRPKYGIYAVRVTLEDGSEHPGVASLGVRPTFHPPQELLEAHLFDFEGDLYGQRIEVALHAYIREEKRFDGIEPLIAHMREDEAAARRLLAIT
jgi:riboflavin kinase/FMN adenylyltransferase